MMPAHTLRSWPDTRLAGDRRSLLFAGELRKAEGDCRVAFQVYENLLQPVLAGKQRPAETFAGSFASKWGYLRQQSDHAVNGAARAPR
jgi:hypothetical protein